jgi:hypothetical protein
MTSLIRARLTGASTYLLLVAVAVVAIAACSGSAAATPVDPGATSESTPAAAAPAATAPPAATPASTDDLLDDLAAASEEFEEFIDTDNDGLNDIEGQVDPDGGFVPTLYVDGDDLGGILGESPDPECSHSSMLDGDACTWTTGDGAASLGVELYRDPNLATREAYVAHMDTLMSGGSPIDDLGAAAYSGPNPLGPGARVTVFVGDGVHLWVTIAADGDQVEIADQALELASKIVAMQ